MYRLHQVQPKLPCPWGPQAEGRVPILFQGVEEEWYSLPLEPSPPPPSRLQCCLSFIDLARFEALTRLHPSRAQAAQHGPRLKASATGDDIILGTRKGVLLALIFPLL